MQPTTPADMNVFMMTFLPLQVDGGTAQDEENVFLAVQPILRLIEHARHVGLEDVRGYLLAAMRGEAMHEEGTWLRQRHQLFVDLVRCEDLAPQLGLVFLAHRRPGISVYRVGAGDGVGRFGEEPQPRAVARNARRLLNDRMRQLIWLGTRHMQVDPEHGRGVRERRRDVVAVADIGDGAAANRPDVLLQRGTGGDRLTRLLAVG